MVVCCILCVVCAVLRTGCRGQCFAHTAGWVAHWLSCPLLAARRTRNAASRMFSRSLACRMLSVVCCPLNAAVARCPFPVVCRVVFCAVSAALPPVVYCLVVCCLFHVVFSSLSVACCPLPVARCPLHGVCCVACHCCSLRIACSLAHVACCALHVVCCSLYIARCMLSGCCLLHV